MQIVHSHAPLAEVEREWEVGMRLNQLAEHDGSLPGFMGVGAGKPLKLVTPNSPVYLSTQSTVLAPIRARKSVGVAKRAEKREVCP